jgi:hypothetical protein
MEEYHVDCHLLSKLNAMAVFHCIVLSYIVIMIININVRASLFNTKVNVIANCFLGHTDRRVDFYVDPIDAGYGALYYKVVGMSPSSTFHCHLNETYNSSALFFATMFSKVLQLIWCTDTEGGWVEVAPVEFNCFFCCVLCESPITRSLVPIID